MSRFITHLAWLSVFALACSGGAAVAEENADDDDDRSSIRMKDPATGTRGMDEGALRRLLHDLDLSEEQQSQIREALHDARERRMTWWREHGEDVRNLRHSVHQARQAGDREQFRESWAQLGELMFGAPDPSAVIQDVNAILTDEQRAQLEVNWQAARERMKHRRGQRHRDDRDQNDAEQGDGDAADQ